MNELLRGEPGAVIIGLNNESATITLGLSKIIELVKKINSTFSPFFMIDKDAAERKAIIDSGFNFFLCHFHNLETWNKRIGKHFKNAPDKNEMKEKIISWINEV